MKKMMIVAVCCSALALGSCSTPSGALGGGAPVGQQQPVQGESQKGGLLGNLLENFLGNSTGLTKKRLEGTWNYEGVDCVFESQNLLMKAGGEIAARKIEAKLDDAMAKVGIGKGSCSFTFKSDGTYTGVMGGRKLSGTYELNAEEKTMTLHYLNGLAHSTLHVAQTGNKLSLLYESDKLLKILNTLSALSKNGSTSALSQLVGAYDGLMVGMELVR